MPEAFEIYVGRNIIVLLSELSFFLDSFFWLDGQVDAVVILRMEFIYDHAMNYWLAN